MYAILCMALFAHGIGFAALLVALMGKKGKGGAPIALGSGALLFGVVCMVLGLVGYLWGMSNTEAAVASVEPAMREMILAQGRSESMNNVYFGCCTTVFPAIAGLVAIMRGLRLRKAGAVPG
jgi:hypothetical protein